MNVTVLATIDKNGYVISPLHQQRYPRSERAGGHQSPQRPFWRWV